MKRNKYNNTCRDFKIRHSLNFYLWQQRTSAILLGKVKRSWRWTHHFLSVVCGHVDPFAVHPRYAVGHLFTPARLLRLQPPLIKLLQVCNCTGLRGRVGGGMTGSVMTQASKHQRWIQIKIEKPTVVLLHVDPKVSFFGAVRKCAVPDVDALLPGRHVHTDLDKEVRDLVTDGRGLV